MGKRAALTAVLSTLIALAAIVAPAAANWTHKGKGELKENASLTLSGELTLSTSAGNVACPTTMGATLTGSGAAGHVNSFTVSKPSECDLTGSLAAICGTHGVTKVEKTGSWALTADETDITLSGIVIDYTLAGCLIPSFRLEGNATGTLDKASAIGKVTLSGTQTLYNSAGEESGTGELKGTLSVSPAGTYGVTTGKSVETIWTDEGKHLASDGKLTLSGAFSFSGSGGSISCPATVKLQLESSTVEEEEAEGEIESFTVSKPSECDLGGSYKETCGSTTGIVSKVEQTGTATLSATEEDIKASGLVLDYELEKCAITSLRVEGSPTVSVTSPESIKEASFSAGSLEVFNAKGETVGTASAGGSASASPSGTFQLVEEPGETHEEKTEREETEETAATEHEATTHKEETETTATESPVKIVESEGSPLEVGAEITATSTNLVTTTVGGTFRCESVVLHLTVGANGPEHVTLNQDGVATTSGCELDQTGIGGGHLPITITDWTFGPLTIDAWGHSEVETTFVQDVYGNAPHTILILSCHLEGILAVEGTVSGSDVLNVTPSALAISGPGCPSVATMHGSFNLETPDETPVELEFSETE
jgi:hypothetical protein